MLTHNGRYLITNLQSIVVTFYTDKFNIYLVGNACAFGSLLPEQISDDQNSHSTVIILPVAVHNFTYMLYNIINIFCYSVSLKNIFIRVHLFCRC
jgi:hypothetical protein